MATDWYRRSEWFPEDAREFDAHLRRARPRNRAQYLRIQAACRMAASPSWAEPALALLERLVAEYPDEWQLAPAHHQRAECLLALRRIDEAIAAFRAALAAERTFPLVRTDAYAAYAYAIAATGRTELFDEALSALDEFAGQVDLPIHQYTTAAARAIIAAERGDPDTAREAASLALAATERSDPGFGLVNHVDAEVLVRLRHLAA